MWTAFRWVARMVGKWASLMVEKSARRSVGMLAVGMAVLSAVPMGDDLVDSTGQTLAVQ